MFLGILYSTVFNGNADSERTLNMLHTEARKSLHADTITAFLQCKINFFMDQKRRADVYSRSCIKLQGFIVYP